MCVWIHITTTYIEDPISQNCDEVGRHDAGGWVSNYSRKKEKMLDCHCSLFFVTLFFYSGISKWPIMVTFFKKKPRNIIYL